MKQNMTLAMEGAGSGVLWGALTFTLLVFTAPFAWIGEAAADLRWHVGVGLLAVGLPGVVLVARRRLSFALVLGMAMMHLVPGVRVLLPVDRPAWGSGDELEVVEVHWGEAPVGALEDLLEFGEADLVVAHGVSPEGRAALGEGRLRWPHEYAWPPLLAGHPLPSGPSLLVFSRHPIADVHAQVFGEDAVLVTGDLQAPALDVPLAIVDLPTLGPGERLATRDDLLKAMDRRYWSERSLVLCRLGTSDSSPSYGRLLDATGLADARQGVGRLPTSPVTIGGVELPFLRVPREFLLHGDYVEVLEVGADVLRAGERDSLTGAVMPDGPERVSVRARVRVRA